jgi:hypothetical protein
MIKQTSHIILTTIILTQFCSCVSIKKYNELQKNYSDLQEQFEKREKELIDQCTTEKKQCYEKVTYLSHQLDSLRSLGKDTIRIETGDEELEKKYIALSVKYDYIKNIVKKAREALCKCENDCEEEKKEK